MNVLVVEDDEDLRGLLLLAVSARGHSVETARDGRRALTMVAVTPPDLILTDLAMPGMDGAGLISNLRCIPRFASLPIIVISGNRAVMRNPVVRDDPAIQVLCKPMSLSQLWQLMEPVETARESPAKQAEGGDGGHPNVPVFLLGSARAVRGPRG